MKTLLDNEYHRLDLEDGIIIATWKNSFIDLDIAKKMVESRLEVLQGKQYPFLIKMKSFRECTKEAREFYASAQISKDYIAGAIHIESILESFIANFFIAVNKPKTNFKIFNSEAKAKKWLAQYVKKD